MYAIYVPTATAFLFCLLFICETGQKWFSLPTCRIIWHIHIVLAIMGLISRTGSVCWLLIGLLFCIYTMCVYTIRYSPLFWCVWSLNLIFLIIFVKSVIQGFFVFVFVWMIAWLRCRGIWEKEKTMTFPFIVLVHVAFIVNELEHMTDAENKTFCIYWVKQSE